MAESPPRQIEDIESWFRANSLGAAPRVTAGEAEDRARVKASDDYEATVHRDIFAESDEAFEKEQKRKQDRLQDLEGFQIKILTSDEVLESDLKVLAESCETVYSMVEWETSSEKKVKDIQLSLDHFPSVSVRDFVSVVNGSKALDDLSAESIVECCQISHYLQNEDILEKTSDILLEAVNKENCLSMCKLADHLDLPQIFERSLTIMMKSLEDMEDKNYWDSLSPELQERIHTIKAAIQSSVHSRQSCLYFATLDEYISIFAERVQYYRERLLEAKEQHALMEVGTRAWKDTFVKIKRQEMRVQTLRAVLDEQKKVFRCKGVIRRAC